MDQRQNYWCQDYDLRLFYGLMCIGAFSLFTRRVPVSKNARNHRCQRVILRSRRQVKLAYTQDEQSSSLIPLVERVQCFRVSSNRSWHDLIGDLAWLVIYLVICWIRLNFNTFLFQEYLIFDKNEIRIWWNIVFWGGKKRYECANLNRNVAFLFLNWGNDIFLYFIYNDIYYK